MSTSGGVRRSSTGGRASASRRSRAERPEEQAQAIRALWAARREARVAAAQFPVRRDAAIAQRAEFTRLNAEHKALTSQLQSRYEAQAREVRAGRLGELQQKAAVARAEADRQYPALNARVQELQDQFKGLERGSRAYDRLDRQLLAVYRTIGKNDLTAGRAESHYYAAVRSASARQLRADAGYKASMARVRAADKAASRAEAVSRQAYQRDNAARTALETAKYARSLATGKITVKTSPVASRLAKALLGVHSQSTIRQLVGAERSGKLTLLSNGGNLRIAFESPSHIVGFNLSREGGKLVMSDVTVASMQKTSSSGQRLVQTLATYRDAGVSRLRASAERGSTYNGS